MVLRQEKYTVRVAFNINCAATEAFSIHDIPVKVASPKDRGLMMVTIGTPDAEVGALIEVLWSFHALFQERFNEHPEHQIWEIWNGSPMLVIPNADGSMGERILAPDEMFAAAKLYLARICIATRSPGFWSKLRGEDLRTLKAEMNVEVAGMTFPMSSAVLSVSLPVRPAEITVERATQIGAEVFPSFATFILSADHRFLTNDYPYAIVGLAQAIEVATYRFLREEVPGKEAYELKLHEVFSNHDRDDAIRAVKPEPFDEESYEILCELFGARHEWIHEGRRLVRLYDPDLRKVPRKNCSKRALTRDDFYRFRSAASKALEWLGELGIE